jgi:outer membrane protein assembly factor BamB
MYAAGTYNTLAPAVVAQDGTIYFGAAANLLALNADGTQKWSFATGSQIYGAPGIGDDGTIYVGSDDYKFYAIKTKAVKVSATATLTAKIGTSSK